MGGFLTIFKGLIGGDPIKSIGDLIDQFHMSPEQKAQLGLDTATLEANREAVTAARDEALAEVAEKNVESARGMQITVKSILPPLLSLVVTIGFFGLLYLIIYRNIPVGSHDVIIAMVGVLGSAWGAVINYYFGSSSGSAEKTNILADNLSAKTNVK